MSGPSTRCVAAQHPVCCVVLKQHTVCAQQRQAVCCLDGWVGGWMVGRAQAPAGEHAAYAVPPHMCCWLPVQCFSAVVGPNGSGKSNVIDAMLFVFGRRAKQVSRDAAQPCTNCRGVGRPCSWHHVAPTAAAQSLPTDVHRSRAQHSTACMACAAGANLVPQCRTGLLLLLLLLQLRFNKVAELIHNSTYHRNLERACVTVHFQEIIDKVCGLRQAVLGKGHKTAAWHGTTPVLLHAAASTPRRSGCTRVCAQQAQRKQLLPPPTQPQRHKLLTLFSLGCCAAATNTSRLHVLPYRLLCWRHAMQEGDEYEVIPGSEFTVARTANRSASGSSSSSSQTRWPAGAAAGASKQRRHWLKQPSPTAVGVSLAPLACF